MRNFSRVCILLVFWLFTNQTFAHEATLSSGAMHQITGSAFRAYVSLANFGQTFGEQNFRGAMPRPESIELLVKTYKVRTIISLVSLKQIPAELQRAITNQHLERIVIPLGDHPPTLSNRKRILAALQRGHVFVHCKHGADRTGAIIARARVELWHVDPQTAYRDMLTYNPKVEKIARYKHAYRFFKAFIFEKTDWM